MVSLLSDQKLRLETKLILLTESILLPNLFYSLARLLSIPITYKLLEMAPTKGFAL